MSKFFYGDEVTITKGKFKGNVGYFAYYTSNLDRKKGVVRFYLNEAFHEEALPVAFLRPTPIYQPTEPTIF